MFNFGVDGEKMNRGHHSSLLLAGIVLITALVWAGECHAQAVTPSFDCKSNHGPDETAVCGNNELSRLDNEMATAYRNALSTASPDATAQLRSIQRDWLNKRKNCGASNVCLKELYERRLVELGVHAPGEPRPVPLASDRPRPDSSEEKDKDFEAAAAAMSMQICSSSKVQETVVSTWKETNNLEILPQLTSVKIEQPMTDGFSLECSATAIISTPQKDPVIRIRYSLRRGTTGPWKIKVDRY